MRKLIIGIAAAGAMLGAVSPAVASEAYGSGDGMGDGGSTVGGFDRDFGDVNIHKQIGVINQNGAPLVYADLVCAAPWAGGVIHGTIGNNYAACNTAPVKQLKTGGLIS